MLFKEEKFLPVLFGNDINVYSLARSFYEEYSIKSKGFGKSDSNPCNKSLMIDYEAVADIDDSEVFLSKVNNLARKNKDKKLILLGCGDNYVKNISSHKGLYEDNVIAPYMDYDKISKLLEKKYFYKLCDKYGISYPKTLEYTKGDNKKTDFKFPVIIKPSDSVTYFDNGFSGQKKVYKIENQEEYESTIDIIYKSGYKDTLIVQEFIPGDDTNLRIIVNYSDGKGKLKMMALGHGLLEEHTPKGIGNLSLIYLDYDKDLQDKLTQFLDEMEICYFTSFDLKFDSRDNTYKVFELNGRQPRSNYYVTAGGFNIVKYLVDDVIYGKQLTREYPVADSLWTVLPKGVSLKYVTNPVERENIKRFYREKKVTNPLMKKGDNNIIRLLSFTKLHFSHYSKYKKYTKGE